MTYRILKSNGELLVDLADGIIDKTHSSVSLIGKNVVNFGKEQNSDVIHMLENFAYATAPVHPLVGQLWYDSQNQSIKVYTDGAIWRQLTSLATSSSDPGASIKGSFWFNTSTNQLSVSDGTTFRLVGPEAVQGFGSTRAISESLADISGFYHPVIKLVIDSEVIAIISKDQFDPSYINAIPGITTIRRGINFTTTNGSGTSGQPVLTGASTTASVAQSLIGEDGSQVSAKTGSNGLIKSLVQRDSLGSTVVNTLTAAKIYSSDGTISGDWKFEGSFKPKSNSVSLGASDSRWNYVYGTTLDATSLNVTNLTANAGSIGTISFTNLKDGNNHSVNSIDIDSTLSASSDSRLSTQKAVKAYVDKAVKDAVDALKLADTGLQNQLTGFGLPVPPGTVCYYAGYDAPAGYLRANGASVSKDTYYKLFIALGGISSPYGQNNQMFNLPNLEGSFIRGLGEPGRGPGSVQAGAIQSHGHTFDDIRWAEIDGAYTYQDPQLGQISVGPGAGSNKGTDYDNGVHFIRHGTYNTGGSETRPPNTALMVIIKY